MSPYVIVCGRISPALCRQGRPLLWLILVAWLIVFFAAFARPLCMPRLLWLLSWCVGGAGRLCYSVVYGAGALAPYYGLGGCGWVCVVLPGCQKSSLYISLQSCSVTGRGLFTSSLCCSMAALAISPTASCGMPISERVCGMPQAFERAAT